MSDSVKLRFEHGIWCLVFSYITLIAFVIFCFLSRIVDASFVMLAFFSFVIFSLLVFATITNFKDAIDYSKKECTNDHIKKGLNKTLD